MKTMESRVNGRASAESARIDGEIKAQKVEHSAELRAVLNAVKSLGQSMDLKVETMEERRVADMNAAVFAISFIRTTIDPTCEQGPFWFARKRAVVRRPEQLRFRCMSTCNSVQS